MSAVYASGMWYSRTPAEVLGSWGQYSRVVLDGILLVWNPTDARYVVA